MTHTTDRSHGTRGEDAYSLPQDALQDLTRQLLVDCPPPENHGPGGQFCCYRLADSSRFSAVARTVECTVFTRFFGNTPLVMSEAYARYERQSLFLLVVDRQAQRPAGTLRVITYRDMGAGLKTLDDIAQEPLLVPTRLVADHHHIDDLRKCWDVGTVAVLKEYRGRESDHIVSTTLYGRLRSEAAASGIEHFVAVLDRHAFSQLVELFAVPFVPIVNTKPFAYLGSESSRAAYCHVPSVVPAMSAYLNQLEPQVARQLRPYIERLAFGDQLPVVVHASS